MTLTTTLDRREEIERLMQFILVKSKGTRDATKAMSPQTIAMRRNDCAVKYLTIRRTIKRSYVRQRIFEEAGTWDPGERNGSDRQLMCHLAAWGHLKLTPHLPPKHI